MNITKYATMFSMAILVTGVIAVTFSVFVANVYAYDGYDHKKHVKIIKFKCNNINININGEEIFSTGFVSPFCFSVNRN